MKDERWQEKRVRRWKTREDEERREEKREDERREEIVPLSSNVQNLTVFFQLFSWCEFDFSGWGNHFSRGFGRHSIPQDEKAWWQGCLQRREPQGNLMRCFHVTMFFRFADAASVGKSLLDGNKDHWTNMWDKNIKWDLSTVVSMNFSNSVGNQVFKLVSYGNGQLFALTAPDLRIPGIPDGVLQQVISQARTANVWGAPFRLTAFSPPGRSRPLSAVSLFDGRFNGPSLWLAALHHVVPLLYCPMASLEPIRIVAGDSASQWYRFDLLQDAADQVRHMLTIGPTSLEWPTALLAGSDQSSPSSSHEDLLDEQPGDALLAPPHLRWRSDALQPPQVQQGGVDWNSCVHIPDGGLRCVTWNTRGPIGSVSSSQILQGAKT